MQIALQISNNGNKINRLLVTPIKKEDTESKIVKPLSKLCKYGKVAFACKDSDFKVDDIVEYLYPDNETDYELSHDGKTYDLIYEREVITHNDDPSNVLFVEQLSRIEQTPTGIFINPETKGITAKGRIIAAPVKSHYQVNKIVEYRKSETDRNFYPQIYYRGVLCEVLKFTDIFKYSGKVSSDRIIIRVNREAQRKKQQKTDSGIQVPNKYRYMRYYLQYAEVIEIGDKAAEWYPKLNVGDLAILHHFVENQVHRVLSVNDEWEYRIINTYDPMSREIMGVMKYHPINGWEITPFGKQIFLEPNIIPFDETFNPQMDAHKKIGGKELPFTNYVSNIEIRHKSANDSYEQHIQFLNYEGRKLNPELDSDVAKAMEIDSEITKVQQDKQKIDFFIKRNFLVIANQLKPKTEYNKIAIPYQTLYPINLMGKDYLIGHEHFVVANIKPENIMRIIKNRVLVSLIEKESKSAIIAPDTVKSQTAEGAVVMIGDGKEIVEGLQEGDVVGFERRSGTPLMMDDKAYLIIDGSSDILYVL